MSFAEINVSLAELAAFLLSSFLLTGGIQGASPRPTVGRFTKSPGPERLGDAEVCFRHRLLLVFSFTADSQNAEQAEAKKRKATSGELFETIARTDRSVFDVFNEKNLERLMSMFTPDLEFYDDGSGVKSFAQTKEDFAKVFAEVPDLRRELVLGSLEVYPLPGYGAIEVGEHRFCHEENGKQDCGVMKFSMVWRQTRETWKLSRVLSYAH